MLETSRGFEPPNNLAISTADLFFIFPYVNM